MLEKLVGLSEAYCAATGDSRASVSKAIFARGGHVDDLASGVRDIATGTFERAVAWFSANWPESAKWPDGIARPQTILNDATAAEGLSPPRDSAGGAAQDGNALTPPGALPSDLSSEAA